MFYLTQIKVLRGLQISCKLCRRLFLCPAQHLVLLKFLVVGHITPTSVFSQCLFLFMSDHLSLSCDNDICECIQIRACQIHPKIAFHLKFFT